MKWRVTLLAIVTLLTGCATPDLKPFAEETAALGSALSAEHVEVAGKFDQIVDKARSRDPRDSRLTRLAEQQEIYVKNASAIDLVMDTVVNYANTLVELAESGETGPQAVDSLSKTLKGFESTLGATIPLLPPWVGALVKEIAQGVTRIQAQKSLADATKAADPTIKHMAAVLSDLYAWPNGAQAQVVTGIHIVEQGVLEDVAGPQRLVFYRGLNVKLIPAEAGRPSQTRLEWFFRDLNDRIGKQRPAAGICGLAGLRGDDPNCLTGETAQSLEAIVSLLSGLEPQYLVYTRDVAASKKWLEHRKAASKPIVESLAAWAADHAKLAKKLEECGGLRAVRKSCGNLTFANLKQSVARLKSIAGKGEE